MPPLNPSLNFPELQRFSSEVQGNCCAWMEKVKHPSGFPGANLPSQVMFWVSPRPTLCNRYRGHGRFGLFLGDVQATVVFSDAVSLAPRAGMFQRTEEWGWAVKKKKKRFKITVSPCLLQPLPLSCTVLLFHHLYCEKKTAWSFWAWIIQQLAN